MAPTINREIARCAANGRWDELRTLLHTLAVIYWCVAALICLIMLAEAPLISGHWLKSKQPGSRLTDPAVMLMGLVVACRWPTGLYQAALNGMQRLTVASGINMINSTAVLAGSGLRAGLRLSNDQCILSVAGGRWIRLCARIPRGGLARGRAWT